MKRTVCLTLFLALLLSGCSVKGAELSRRLVIEAIGIDKKEEGYAVTLQTLDTHSAGTGSDASAGDNLVKIYVFEGESVGEALSRITEATGLVPLFSQTRIIVLGKACAEENVFAALDFFLREYNIRSDVLIAAAQNDAGEIVSADLGDSVPDAVILEDSVNYGAQNGLCVFMPLYKFINYALSETDAAFCPVLSVKNAEDPKKKEPKITGTAFFKNKSLSFVLDDKETRGLLFLTDGIKKTSFTTEGNEGKYTLEVVSSKTKIKTEKTANGFVFLVNVKLECDVSEYISANFCPLDETRENDAKEAGTRFVKELITNSFNRLYGTEHIDVCRFYRRALLKDPKSADEFREKTFDEAFAQSEIEVELTIRRTGKENG